MKSTVTVKKSEPPESKEILAAAITNISDGLTKLLASGLNRKAIIVLIQAETRQSRTEIEAVLDALARLKGWYCR